MIRNTRNVYIVENIKSDRIEQAIFILKPNFDLSKKCSDEIAVEAEKIISNYISKLESDKKLIKKNKKKINPLAGGIFITSLIVVSLIILNILR